MILNTEFSCESESMLTKSDPIIRVEQYSQIKITINQWNNSAQFLGECVRKKDIESGLATAFKKIYLGICYDNMYLGMYSQKNKFVISLAVQRVHQSNNFMCTVRELREVGWEKYCEILLFPAVRTYIIITLNFICFYNS